MTTPLIIIRDIRARHFPRFYCRRDFRQIRLTVRRQRCNFCRAFLGSDRSSPSAITLPRGRNMREHESKTFIDLTDACSSRQRVLLSGQLDLGGTRAARTERRKLVLVVHDDL